MKNYDNTWSYVDDVLNTPNWKGDALLGKVKLIQSMFGHGTHGQITVQGVTVRADDLSAVRVR